MKNFKINLSKKEYIIFVIALIITLLSFSYAFFMSTDMFGNNIATTECFKLTLVDSNDINLDKTYPMSEGEGSNLTPYTFTIKNVCNLTADYQVNIETLNTTTIDTQYIRVKLDDEESNILKDYELNTNNVNNIVSEGRVITTGKLRANEEKTYYLRMWVDENSTVLQSEDKIYHGKVTITSVPVKEQYDVEIAYIYDGQSQPTPPLKNSGYIIESVTCENADGYWDGAKWGLMVNNISGYVRCNLVFQEGNNIQKWLDYAEIEKDYTTITEVLNDGATVGSLMSNNAACDFLSQTADWVSEITSNETAMTYIGNNSYCADKLYFTEIWYEPFAQSTYWNKVLVSLVPKMTSNTAPSGVVSSSSYYGANYLPWKAFNGTYSASGYDGWLTTTADRLTPWIQYEFTEPQKVKVLYIVNTGYWGVAVNIKRFIVQGWNGESFVNIDSFDSYDLGNFKQSKYVLNNNEYYKIYRIQVLENNGSASYTGLMELQYWGR